MTTNMNGLANEAESFMQNDWSNTERLRGLYEMAVLLDR